MHSDAKSQVTDFFDGLREHEPSAKQKGISDKGMVKNGCNNMSGKKGADCPCSTAARAVKAGRLVESAGRNVLGQMKTGHL